MKLRLLVTVGMLCLLVSACATFRHDPQIQVSLVNLQFGASTAFETTLLATLRIQNENPEAIVLDGATHKIYLDGLNIGQGLASERLEIQRLNSATQTVTFHVSNIAVATRLQRIVQSRRFDYRIDSKLYLLEGNHSRRVRTERTGRFDLEQFRPSQTQQ